MKILTLAFALLLFILVMALTSGCAGMAGGEITVAPMVGGTLAQSPQAWNDPMGAMFLGSWK